MNIYVPNNRLKICAAKTNRTEKKSKQICNIRDFNSSLVIIDSTSRKSVRIYKTQTTQSVNLIK